MPYDNKEEPSVTDRDRQLPMAPTPPDEEDDGIFMRWPGAPDEDAGQERSLHDTEDLYDGYDGAEDEETDEAEDEDALVLPRKKKKKNAAKDRGSKKGQKGKKAKRNRRGEEDGTDSDRMTEGDADGTEDYLYRAAAESDREESYGRPHKKKDEADNEGTLSSIKYYKHTQRVRDLLLRRILPCVLVVAFMIGFVLYFFRLQHLTFDNLTGYPAEDVFDAIGLKKNMFVFRIREGDIERRLRSHFPYIEDVEVELELPDTAHLVFTEDCALFYTQIYDEYFVISESMRVLSRFDRKEDLPKGLRGITLPAVSYAVVGHTLTFYDASYIDFLREFLSVMENSDVYAKVGTMDLSNRFYLRIDYDDRLEIDLGGAEDLDTKLLFVKSIVAELDEDDRGNVTLIDNKKATFSPAPLTTE